MQTNLDLKDFWMKSWVCQTLLLDMEDGKILVMDYTIHCTVAHFLLLQDLSWPIFR